MRYREVVVVVLLVVAVSHADLGAERGRAGDAVVRGWMERVVHPAEDPDFTGSYTVSTTSVERNGDGDPRHRIEVRLAVSREAGGFERRQVLRVIQDGRDLTAASRRKLAARRTGVDRTHRGDFDIVKPFGPEATFYRFGPPQRVQGLLLADFTPQDRFREASGMTHGTVALDARTHQPRWLELAAVRPPRPLDELEMRFEFSPRAGRVYVTRVHGRGHTGWWLFARHWDLDVRVSDIAPSG